jgi:ssDNA thymidine ADP-ribosyltransferase, DarT
MNRGDINELHNIQHIINIPSILSRGILSHNLASKQKAKGKDISDIEPQGRRSKVVVPGGRRLHDYANLYINGRNKMMYKVTCKYRHAEICVLCIDTSVLDLMGVVIADCNASSDYVRFYPSPEGLSHIDSDLVFARSWKHPEDIRKEWRHGSIICAEVLVPDKIDSGLIWRIYVSCSESMETVQNLVPNIPVEVNRDMFFL